MKTIHAAAMASTLLIAAGAAGPARAQDETIPTTTAMLSCPFDYSRDSRILGDMIGVAECWPTEVADGNQLYLNDLYTRWIVEEVGIDPNLGHSSLVRDYRAERHSAFERIFVGRQREATVTVKIRMKDPDVDFTIPLLSVDYDARRGKGQSFNTLLSRSDMSLPAFRITPTTSASVETQARASNQIDVQATGIVLTALKDTLSIVAPTSSLLTSINREQVQRTSSAYDAALSKLLSSTRAETTTTSRLLSEWRPGSAFLVSVDIPNNVRTRTAPGVDRRIWFKIKMACPRVSAFDTLNVCELAEPGNVLPLVASPHMAQANGSRAAGHPGTTSSRYHNAVDWLRGRISAHQVLSFQLGTNKSIRQFLTEQEWFISLSKAILTAPAKVNSDAAKQAPIATPGDSVATGEIAVAGTASTPTNPTPAASRSAPPAADAEVADSVTNNTLKANELCEAIAEKLYSAGLSRLDANIGLWATVTGMPDFTNSRGIFQNAPSCREHLPRDTAAWRFEAAPPPAPKPARVAPPVRRRGAKRT